MDKRCPTPWKVRYRNGVTAKIALTKLDRQDKDGHHEVRAYRCPCGGWHLTSKRERSKRG
ncbi:MAG: hypothetical protein BGO26_10220 [Actinobacteria bacterium 69-20]|nr:hypothetical protein [Actinomycetota bacterium]OJV23274.1 MAG: hypothetical protein BGO26_10220 [Actinobacteria bacterium 69-20]